MPFEVLLWTGAASIGAVVSLLNLRSAHHDLEELRAELAERADGELIIAKGWVRDEVVRSAIQVAWVAAGLYVLAGPASEFSLHGATVPLMLFSNFLVMFNTIMNARDRLELKNHWLQ